MCSCGRRVRMLSRASFLRTLITFMRVPSSWPSKAPPLSAITLRVRMGGVHRNIETIAITNFRNDFLFYILEQIPCQPCLIVTIVHFLMSFPEWRQKGGVTTGISGGHNVGSGTNTWSGGSVFDAYPLPCDALFSGESQMDNEWSIPEVVTVQCWNETHRLNWQLLDIQVWMELSVLGASRLGCP